MDESLLLVASDDDDESRIDFAADFALRLGCLRLVAGAVVVFLLLDDADDFEE